MPSDIFSRIIDQEIDEFTTKYSRIAEDIFKSQIHHPGEYGSYRESIIKDFLKLMISQDIEAADGFIITKDNSVSTQCDIVIYDSKNTPILRESNKKFIPVETAMAIGEAKSTMSKTDFISALIKLAKNKKLREEASGTVIKKTHPREFDSKVEHLDQIFTFLICKKLNFDIQTLDFDEIYKDFDASHRHNLILSLEDGLFMYKFNFDLLGSEKKEIYANAGVDVSLESIIEYPSFLQAECPHEFIEKTSTNPLIHIREFVSCLHNGVSQVTVLAVDIRQYYRRINGKLFT